MHTPSDAPKAAFELPNDGGNATFNNGSDVSTAAAAPVITFIFEAKSSSCVPPRPAAPDGRTDVPSEAGTHKLGDGGTTPGEDAEASPAFVGGNGANNCGGGKSSAAFNPTSHGAVAETSEPPSEDELTGKGFPTDGMEAPNIGGSGKLSGGAGTPKDGTGKLSDGAVETSDRAGW